LRAKHANSLVLNTIALVLLAAGGAAWAVLAPSNSSAASLIVISALLATPCVTALVGLRRHAQWFTVGIATALNVSCVVVVLTAAAVALTNVAGTLGLLVLLVPMLALLAINVVFLMSAFRSKWANPSIERTS